MFTGLIEAVGEVAGREVRRRAGALRVRLREPLSELIVGESVAISGVCLTLEAAAGRVLRFHALAETLARSHLGELPVGAKVNVERALRLGDRLGGHLVTGHVDAVGEVLAVEPVAGGDLALTVALPAELRRQVVAKGSIAVDGVSLTVAALAEDRFTVHLIPETRRRTCLGERAPGDLVNLETDLLGKYVLRALSGKTGGPGKGLDMAVLRQAGW